MLRLSNLDAALLHGETPEMPMHTMGILLLEKPAHAFCERLERTLNARLHLIPPFRRRLVAGPMQIGDPHWIEDPDFRLSNHLLRAAIPAPGGKRELQAFAGLLAGRLLDRSRPLWEMHVVEGLRGGSIALIVKVHHAVMDGSRLVALMGALLDPSPRVRRVPPPQGDWEPEQEPTLGWKALDTSRSLLRRPYHLLRSVTEIGATLLRREDSSDAADHDDAGGPPRPRVFTAPPTPFNGRLSTLRALGMNDVSLDTVKTIKDVFGTTVNDVVLAASCAALREWLLAHDALPEEPLLASVPVAQPADENAPERGNRISMILVALPIGEKDPVQRLRAINAQTAGAKKRHSSGKGDVFRQTADLLLNMFLPTTLSRIMTVYASSELADRIAPPWNLVISNVPGPQKPLYCAGARVQRIYPFGPLQLGSGINITVISAMGRLCVGALACRRMMPDVALITDTFAAEIARLERASRRRRVAAPGRA
ncbi:MAG: putative diacylglycerol O-acyltransferase [Pseudomonadales bacterium]|nr:putative diacylglycerol O-acyltransferase [Pseudomonadales bacterium]